MTPSLLPVRDVAARWSMPDRRVRELIATGRLAAVKVGQRGMRIAMGEVERFERATRR